ncbi:Oidioi.mRNA.OKI2018_I69.PAR.g8878.t1.cds [Oikopleura dioica]|uniref:Oidioi.mRNA.OKI2018_I69.PAR.g8878.t1.cds n=1 Tax=Oikopleura dioica TaxID=34765 RepID=A0ABN7RM34_OIKDI|nr:Oidioi.mRNA.OKI2018_I69.PAR.g8878.t1.cds [Oikopleura dioica]
MTYNSGKGRKSRIPRKRPAQFGIPQSKVRIHEEKIAEGFAASDSQFCCFSDHASNANGLNLTQNGRVPVSVERLENDPWLQEEQVQPVLKYSSELEGILRENRQRMRHIISRIPRPKVEVPPSNKLSSRQCTTLAVWQPPPIIPQMPAPESLLQISTQESSNYQTNNFSSRESSPEASFEDLHFEITERGDNFSPERMDTD